MSDERSIRKSLLLNDLSRNDWSTRMLRERVELEAFGEREREVREARRRAERQRAQSNSASFVDARIERYLHEIYSTAIAQFTSEYVTKRTKEFRQRDAELEAKIAELEKRLERQSKANREFKFARGRGDKREPSLPVRTIQKVHYN